jgi:hypothetical protein
VTPSLSMFSGRVITAHPTSRPEADRPGKGGDEMNNPVLLILAITLMVAIIRSRT